MVSTEQEIQSPALLPLEHPLNACADKKRSKFIHDRDENIKMHGMAPCRRIHRYDILYAAILNPPSSRHLEYFMGLGDDANVFNKPQRRFLEIDEPVYVRGKRTARRLEYEGH